MKPIRLFAALIAVCLTLTLPVCADTVNDTNLPSAPLGGDKSDGTVSDTELPDTPLGGKKPGDVNGDSKIDSTDARLTLQYFVGTVNNTDLSLATADVNMDTKVDSTDARLILQYFVGSITEFPVG